MATDRPTNRSTLGLIFFLAALVLYLSQTYLTQQKLKPISPFHLSLLLSGIALFTTAIFTYLALSVISPTQYILWIIALGVSLPSFIREAHQKRPLHSPFIVLIVCILTNIWITQYESFSLGGTLFGILSGLGFGAYAEISRKYKEDVAQISVRYPAFLAWLSVIALILSLPLLSLTHLSRLSSLLLLTAVGFAFVFTFLPYAIYYRLVHSMEASILDRQLLFVCLSTMAGEIFLTSSPIPLLAFPVLLALFRWQRRAPMKT